MSEGTGSCGWDRVKLLVEHPCVDVLLAFTVRGAQPPRARYAACLREPQGLPEPGTSDEHIPGREADSGTHLTLATLFTYTRLNTLASYPRRGA